MREFCIAQTDIFPKLRRILRHNQICCCFALLRLGVGYNAFCLQIIGYAFHGIHLCQQLSAFRTGKRGIRADCALIGKHLVKLLFGNHFNRIPNSESRQQKRRTARHTEHGHEQPFFIAEQIAACRFLRKVQMQPNKVDILHKGTSARLRRRRAHQCGRIVGKCASACGKRTADGCAYGKYNRNNRIEHLHTNDGLRQIDINQPIRAKNQRRQQRLAEHHAEQTAEQCRQQCVPHIFCRDFTLFVAQRLQRADLGAFLFDHAGHGG